MRGACAFGATAAAFGMVATQAMSGREDAGQLLGFFLVILAGTYGAGATVFLLPLLRPAPRAYAVGVAGFIVSGIGAAMAAALATGAGLLNFRTLQSSYAPIAQLDRAPAF